MRFPRYRHIVAESLQTPNVWDIVAFLIIFGILAAMVWGASHMATPYHLGDPITISLDPAALPGYALRTVLRMFVAILFSVLFTLTVAPLAAKNAQAEKLVIPLIDIMQSIPPLGVLSIVFVGFIHWFPNSLLGPEFAAIFVIFTSQVWNMTLSFYQSLCTLPSELEETAAIFQLSAWQRFWRIDVPHAIPALLWNAMMSMSAGWFFLVASEAISVSNQNILLPGIGSYISEAIRTADFHAILYAIVAMFVVILLYDQLLFRPLLVWSDKFRIGMGPENEERNTSWFYDLLIKTRLLKLSYRGFAFLKEALVNAKPFLRKPPHSSTITALLHLSKKTKTRLVTLSIFLWNVLLIVGLLASCFALVEFILHKVQLSEIWHVFFLGSITALKIFILLILASLIWIPVGVWVGLRPGAQKFVQPLVQFLAAFPVNLIYPVIVTGILYYQLNVDIWSSPLMILGTQWYLIFNIIAGAAAIPQETRLAAQNFGVRGWLWWKRLILPAIFPYYITGLMTAAGGAWNASIVADVLKWGDKTLVATGLGSYITHYTESGDFPRIALGIGVMCLFVLLINRLVWHRLYVLAASRFVME